MKHLCVHEEGSEMKLIKNTVYYVYLENIKNKKVNKVTERNSRIIVNLQANTNED